MQLKRVSITLGMLAVVVAGGLFLGPAGFGPGERSAEAVGLSEVKKLLASDAQTADNFGFSVAVSVDTAVVGAYREDAGGDDAGAVYVLGRDAGGTNNWGEVKKLIASDSEDFDHFGQSVAVSGDTAVVGADFEDAGGGAAGAVYIFQRDQGGADNWGEVKKLLASDAESGDGFGFSVALSANTAVVGAYLEDTGGGFSGAAYVFERDEGGADNWGEVKKLTASDAAPFDFFGASLAVSGNTAVVGAVGAAASGAAYLFERDEGGTENWGEVKKLTAPDPEAGDNFGVGVAVSGDTAVVGAIGDDAGGIGFATGAAFVFGRDQGGADNWGELKKLIASDAEAGDEFGTSVAISGDTAVVGKPRDDAGGSLAGAAYVFGRNEGGADNWGEANKLTASDAETGDRLGRVAVSGDTAIAGAPREDAGGADAGAAYIFDLLQPKPTPTPTPTPKPPDGDTDGDTIPNSSDPDDDNDGCTDVAELDPKSEAVTGGGRDPHSYWDFMDMWVNKQKDRRVNIIDIGAIVSRLFTAGDPGGDPLDPPQDLTSYHVSADRSPPEEGANLWNAGPADGTINIIEIGLAVVQFGHNCSGLP